MLLGLPGEPCPCSVHQSLFPPGATTFERESPERKLRDDRNDKKKNLREEEKDGTEIGPKSKNVDPRKGVRKRS